ncbi:carboxypeptidase-like regulatory domain-containing protein [Rhizosphaericola mali]|uniref:Carboxypeptidase-like regulatory domain-containing protein n=1 Tax=Rhizosphaericola mali TaxID=2545455 RepID=A0A5P2G2D9_9BACT|nr:carboxypeptidase-like regulatory domain-containing protein [Rhizosphaericola mali]QES88259.1 carboxypeptidase-like regulatory domain-containing protein [Rhizosphaericola mali]
MRFILIFLLNFIICNIYAQTHILNGRILDTKTNKALEGVAVYISNTSIYTITKGDGSFQLQNIPVGNMQIIFSMVGYEKLVLTTDKIKNNDQYHLTPKVNDLDAIVIQSYDKNGWEKYGKFFLDQFIGTLSYSNECILENYKDLKFKYYKKTKELSVTCEVPLIIKNYYLGYNIRYDLIEFRFNYSSKYLFFGGYPSFQNMDVKDSKYKRFLKRRQEAYIGSQMHFIRSLYSRSAIQEGFEMHHIWEEPNYEKQRIKIILDSISFVNENIDSFRLIKLKFDSLYNNDSVRYFHRIIRQDDYLTLMRRIPLQINQVIQDHDSTSKILIYKDQLLVLYKNKKEDINYANYNANYRTDSCIISLLDYLPDTQTQIHQDGSFYPFSNIVQQKYWAWSEKISNLLPFDYVPQNVKP